MKLQNFPGIAPGTLLIILFLVTITKGDESSHSLCRESFGEAIEALHN